MINVNNESQAFFVIEDVGVVRTPKNYQNINKANAKFKNGLIKYFTRVGVVNEF